jgi:hypothetical protein
MARESIRIEVGEKATLKPSGKVKGEGNRFHIPASGSAVVETKEGESPEDASSVVVVGAAVGRARFSFGPDHGVVLTDAERMRGVGATERTHDIFDVEVVPKGGKLSVPAGPLASSNIHEGLLPMSETQEGPSEATPYGMDQENKPVSPHPSMTVGDKDFGNVARVAEDAEATGPQSPEEKAKKTTGKGAKKGATKGAKKGASKSATKGAAKKSAATPSSKRTSQAKAKAEAEAKARADAAAAATLATTTPASGETKA